MADNTKPAVAEDPVAIQREIDDLIDQRAKYDQKRRDELRKVTQATVEKFNHDTADGRKTFEDKIAAAQERKTQAIAAAARAHALQLQKDAKPHG